MRLSILLLTATFISVSLYSVSAETYTPKIDNRQINQENRIQQGVDSGSINSNEAAGLEKGQTHIENKKNFATADGVVTKAERKSIKKSLNRNSKRIYRSKHNAY